MRRIICVWLAILAQSTIAFTRPLQNQFGKQFPSVSFGFVNVEISRNQLERIKNPFQINLMRENRALPHLKQFGAIKALQLANNANGNEEGKTNNNSKNNDNNIDNSMQYSDPLHYKFSPAFDKIDAEEERGEQEEDKGAGEKIPVRFINVPSHINEGADILTVGSLNENLLSLAEKVGLNIPRACRTGLCGTCSADVQDPNFVVQEKIEASEEGTDNGQGVFGYTGRTGWQIVRTCTTNVMLLPGTEEMVVDVHRMQRKKKKKKKSNNSNASESENQGENQSENENENEMEEEKVMNPMERFSGDWERDFRPDYKEGGWQKSHKNPSSPTSSEQNGGKCPKCDGKGVIPCYSCQGKGFIMQSNGVKQQCFLCMSRKVTNCANCQGTGTLSRKKKINF